MCCTALCPKGKLLWSAHVVCSQPDLCSRHVQGHGTHVAGTCVGSTYGVAKKVRQSAECGGLEAVGEQRPALRRSGPTPACPVSHPTPQAVIHGVKTMGDDGSGSYSNIIAGGRSWLRAAGEQ